MAFDYDRALRVLAQLLFVALLVGVATLSLWHDDIFWLSSCVSGCAAAGRLARRA